MGKQPDSFAKQAGVTPAKMALIGVLAFVLMGVLYIQFAPAKKQAPIVAPAAPPVARTAANTNQAVAGAEISPIQDAPLKKTGTVTKWQSPGLTTVVAYDPFALPAAFPQPKSADEAAVAQDAAAAQQNDAEKLAALAAERAKSEGDLQGLKQQAVKVMITRNDEFVAIVGDEEVHVGDELNGFRVIAIDSDGVHVAKDLTP